MTIVAFLFVCLFLLFHTENADIDGQSTPSAEEPFVGINNKTYIRELELHQKGNVRQPLITPNHTPPQEVVYMASYSVYREDSREHLIEQANFEFTAKLRRNHAHHPQARGSQANIPDILPS